MVNLVETRPNENIDAVTQATIEKAKEKFNQVFAHESAGLYPKGNQIGLGVLRPWHVNLDSATLATRGRWQWTASAGWSDWINFTVYRHTYIIEEGITNYSAVPQAYELRLQAGGQVYPVISLEDLQIFVGQRGWFEAPIVCNPTDNMVNRLNCNGTNREYIRLNGTTVALASYLQDETPPTE